MKPFIRFSAIVHPTIIWEDEDTLDQDQLGYAKLMAQQLEFTKVPGSNVAVVYWGHEEDFSGMCLEAKTKGLKEWREGLEAIFYSAYPLPSKTPMTSLEVSKKFMGPMPDWKHKENAEWIDGLGTRIKDGGTWTWKDTGREFIKQTDGRWIEK